MFAAISIDSPKCASSSSALHISVMHICYIYIHMLHLTILWQPLRRLLFNGAPHKHTWWQPAAAHIPSLVLARASIMINAAGLSWDINLQLNIRIILPKNTNYAVISALLDNSQPRVGGNLLQRSGHHYNDFSAFLYKWGPAVLFTVEPGHSRAARSCSKPSLEHFNLRCRSFSRSRGR